MRIAYLSSSFFPSKAANSVHVVRMCEAFTKMGHDVTLFAFSDAERDCDLKSEYGFKHLFKTKMIPRKKNSRLAKLISFFRLGRMVDCSQFDLIYCRNVASVLFLRGKKPLVLEVHALLGSVWKMIINILFHRKNVVAVVAITQALAMDFAEMFPRSTNKILVASDCASVPESPQVDGYDNCETVGYIGHLYEGRGIEIAVGLAKAFPTLKFIIVGGEDNHVEDWKRRCSSISNIFFEGHVAHAKLGEYYARIDIMLAPYQNAVRVGGNKGDTSRWMSPLKLFEYMSYGKPMIVSDLPVLREVMKDGETCLLCEPDDLKSWETQLKCLANDKELRQTLSQTAYSDFLNNYTWDARVLKIISYVEEIC